jgi:chlorite dismutase
VSGETRQLVRYLLLKLDPAWRRQPVESRGRDRAEFGEALRAFRGRLLLRVYSLVGTRGDADLLLWQAADDLETLHALQAAIYSTGLGCFLSIPYSYLGMTRRSLYEFPALDAEPDGRLPIRPQDSRYLFLYPFVKTREWYALPLGDRQRMMDEHVRIGRRHPGVRINTTYSFGLDDQEFVVAFESDDPADFLDLVMELRETEASRYTLRDTPTFTALQMSIWEALDALGGADPGAAAVPPSPPRDDGFVAVAALADLPDGHGKRVYLGADAIALFNVGGAIHAVSDRCPHGRASLSEGRVDPVSGALECPWHGGKFDLATGQPVAPPVRAAIRVYRVKVEAERILVG